MRDWGKAFPSGPALVSGLGLMLLVLTCGFSTRSEASWFRIGCQALGLLPVRHGESSEVEFKRKVERALSAPDDDPAFEFKVSESLIALGVDIRDQGIGRLALDVECRSALCRGMRELTEILKLKTDPPTLEKKLAAWFRQYLPDFNPVYGKEVTEIVILKKGRDVRDGPTGIIVPPDVYAELMLDGKIVINDLHDLLCHLPMLLEPKIRAQVKRHFQIAAKFLRDKPNPFDTIYYTLRNNYYESFLYFDPQSKTLNGLGGRVWLLKYDLLQPLFNLNLPRDPSSPVFIEGILKTTHGSWGQDNSMLDALDEGIQKLAPRILEEVKGFTDLPIEKRSHIVWLYASRLIANDPKLRQYFSLENQLQLWDKALENFKEEGAPLRSGQ
jgi:hypothetical protein